MHIHLKVQSFGNQPPNTEQFVVEVHHGGPVIRQPICCLRSFPGENAKQIHTNKHQIKAILENGMNKLASGYAVAVVVAAATAVVWLNACAN